MTELVKKGLKLSCQPAAGIYGSTAFSGVWQAEIWHQCGLKEKMAILFQTPTRNI